jgi:hypothetical protein
MPHGARWSDDIAEAVIRMSASCKKDEETTALTGIPGRSIRRMRKLWIQTGLPYVPKLNRRKRTGHKRILSLADLKVYVFIPCQLSRSPCLVSPWTSCPQLHYIHG